MALPKYPTSLSCNCPIWAFWIFHTAFLSTTDQSGTLETFKSYDPNSSVSCTVTQIHDRALFCSESHPSSSPISRSEQGFANVINTTSEVLAGSVPFLMAGNPRHSYLSFGREEMSWHVPEHCAPKNVYMVAGSFIFSVLSSTFWRACVLPASHSTCQFLLPRFT